MKMLLGIVVVAVLAAAGAGSAWVLRPQGGNAPGEVEVVAATDLSEPDYVQMTREFIVPIVGDGRVRAHMVLTLSLESATLESEVLLARAPVLRDRLLEALFRHAGTGGFDGRFTDALAMNRLRATLNEAVAATLHPDRATVLVTSIDKRER